MDKKTLLKKLEEIINDKEFDLDTKMFLITSYLKISKKTNTKKGVEK